MKTLFTITTVILCSIVVQSQHVIGGEKLIVEYDNLYLKQDNGESKPPLIWRYGGNHNENEILWISSDSLFNGDKQIWDIVDNQILTFSITRLNSNILSAFHLTPWDSLSRVNKLFFDKRTMSVKDNWPVDYYRLLISDRPLRNLNRSYFIKKPIFMDLNIGGKVSMILYDSESGLITNWIWSDSIEKLGRFGVYFGNEDPPSVAGKNSTKWQKISELQAPESLRPPFNIFPNKSKDEYLLIDHNFNTFLIHPNSDIVEIDLEFDESTVFVLDKNENLTYFLNAPNVNNIIKELSVNRGNVFFNVRENIKKYCQYVY